MAFGNLTDQLAILKRQDLTPTEKFVAVVALSFRNAESGRCNPAIISDDSNKETLCSRSGYTKQCVTKTLRSLAAKGVISLKKAIARPSEITFTVNDVYGKQGLPSTTITDTVNDVYGRGKQRLPITDKEQINEQINLSVDGSSFSLEPDQPPVANVVGGDKAAKKAPKSREQKHPFDLKGLPDKWRQYIVKVRPDLDPEVVFTDFAFYWTEGQGRGERRTDRGWSGTWMTWVRRQNNQRSPAARPSKKHIPDHLNPKIRFDESYYSKENPFNPDGSLNWKRAPDTERNE